MRREILSSVDVGEVSEAMNMHSQYRQCAYNSGVFVSRSKLNKQTNKQ